MNVLRRKQAFLQNLSNMVEGYAQHNIYKQEEFIDRIENEIGGIDNFSERLVGAAIGDNRGDFLEANNPEFVRSIAIALVQEFLRREKWYLKLSGEKNVPPEKVGVPTKGQRWRSESFKELHKSIGQFSRVVLAPTSKDMFAILSDLAGLPEPLVIGSSFKTLPNMNTSTGQYYPRVVEFDAYLGYDGVAQQVLPPDYIIKDCKKVGIYGTTEGKIGLCVSAPGIFFPETEKREPRDSWFAVTCGEVPLAQVQTKGILAGAFLELFPWALLVKITTLRMSMSFPRICQTGKAYPWPSRSCLSTLSLVKKVACTTCSTQLKLATPTLLSWK